MSINWVMLSPTQVFTPLPGEQRLAQSPPRITFNLQSLNKYPGKEPFSVSSNNGTAYLTNRRIVYIPDSPTAQLKSFAAPLLNLHDTHVTAPWFGPNVWSGLVQPVLNGGIPSHIAAVEMKMTFKEGGAYDFHNQFAQIKERVHQAVRITREANPESIRTNGTGGADNVNWDAVHLEQLPAYEDTGSLPAHITPTIASENVARRDDPGSAVLTSASRQPTTASPSEAPPGYEETQRDTVAEHLERNLRL